MSDSFTRPALVLIAVDPCERTPDLTQWFSETWAPRLRAVPGVNDVSLWDIPWRYGKGANDERVRIEGDNALVFLCSLDDVSVARSEAYLDEIGRDFTFTALLDSKEAPFDVLMQVTLEQIRDHTTPEAAAPDGMLVVSITPERDYVDTLHRWYDEVHVGELMSCSGFVRTRRYRALDGLPNYFAIYELDSPDALLREDFLRTSRRGMDQLTEIHQTVLKHSKHNVCDAYRRLA